MNTQDFKKELQEWIDSDNVVKFDVDQYGTQCTQYRKTFTLQELTEYFYKEYYSTETIELDENGVFKHENGNVTFRKTHCMCTQETETLTKYQIENCITHDSLEDYIDETRSDNRGIYCSC